MNDWQKTKTAKEWEVLNAHMDDQLHEDEDHMPVWSTITISNITQKNISYIKSSTKCCIFQLFVNTFFHDFVFVSVVSIFSFFCHVVSGSSSHRVLWCCSRIQRFLFFFVFARNKNLNYNCFENKDLFLIFNYILSKCCKLYWKWKLCAGRESEWKTCTTLTTTNTVFLGCNFFLFQKNIFFYNVFTQTILFSIMQWCKMYVECFVFCLSWRWMRASRLFLHSHPLRNNDGRLFERYF